ncbi:MAG: M20 family metallopeptidase [Actinobacteria bacterium]|jgi:amidohydrolase|nr:M20 family metallopeptidase [Actinomycetota bacterium]MBT3687727.1 M20 family metallopeptidase [Actinomycetota bacterium]MBT4036989.1 M20 family metallopeptidase [Actinomycetota bacterium]MBT4279238.1 M20 family metallopeptidase [Actinomycetota bacterium]MBT4344136.1 M20 family metallopeptidase [Actinomycetota bacterium]
MADDATVVGARQRVLEKIDDLADTLISASHQIHAQPELGFKEHLAHELLTGVLEAEGMDVVRSAYSLETAFEASAGSEGPLIAVLCEYDALPGIGHACGHNIIATAGLGAGLAAAAVATELGGRVRILGTPAEEGGGGKVLMLERGAFDDVDAALMVHPADADLRNITSLAVQQIQAVFTGRAAHAAAAPERGLNALDAAVLGYMNVAALRQHIAPEERIHGIFTDAGQRANIVPERAAASWYVRSPNRAGADALAQRVIACLDAGALASGCSVSHELIQPSYNEVRDNQALLDRYVANSVSLGRDVHPTDDHQVVGSTDLGNVSYVVPAIHPMIKTAPMGTAIHTNDFAAAAISDEADQAILHGARSMALTVLDCWADNGVLEAARDELASAVAVREGDPRTT